MEKLIGIIAMIRVGQMLAIAITVLLVIWVYGLWTNQGKPENYCMMDGEVRAIYKADKTWFLTPEVE